MISATPGELEPDLAPRPNPVREEDPAFDPTRRRLWRRLQVLRQSRERRAQAALAVARQHAAKAAAECSAEETRHLRTQQELAVERQTVLQSRIGRPMPRREFEQIAIEYRRLDARLAASANHLAEARHLLTQAEAEVSPCTEHYRRAARASERIAEALRREPGDEQ